MEKPSTELAVELKMAQARDEQGRLTHTGGGTAKFATNDARSVLAIIVNVIVAIAAVVSLR